MEEYRKNAAVVVFNQEGQVLLFARADAQELEWQFPQGGIDEGETPLQAAYRELQEETGLTSVELVSQIPYGIKYKFSSKVIEKFKNLGRTNVGQEQYWTLFYFIGEDSEINFYTHPEEIEFKAYQWVDIEKSVARVVDFKKESYRQMIDYFKPIIAEYLSDK